MRTRVVVSWLGLVTLEAFSSGVMQNSLKKNDSVNVPVDLKVSQTNSDQNKLVI